MKRSTNEDYTVYSMSQQFEYLAVIYNLVFSCLHFLADVLLVDLLEIHQWSQSPCP